VRASARRYLLPRGRVVLAPGLAACLVLVLAGCSANGPAAPTAEVGATPVNRPSVVRTIDPAALRATVEATARELMIPGALVEVRTPQGAFTTAVGTT
jgi:D-alanyl-D-alanine carboxypeptidase